MTNKTPQPLSEEQIKNTYVWRSEDHRHMISRLQNDLRITPWWKIIKRRDLKRSIKFWEKLV